MAHGHPVSLRRKQVIAQENHDLQILRSCQNVKPAEIGRQVRGAIVESAVSFECVLHIAAEK